MKDGSEIRRVRGETLIQAAVRQSSTAAPVVLLGFVEPIQRREVPAQAFYQGGSNRTRITEVYTESEDESDENQGEFVPEEYCVQPTDEPSDGTHPHKVYLSIPRGAGTDDAYVQAAEWSVTGLKTMWREIFDGVHMKSRERSRTQNLQREIPGSENQSGKAQHEALVEAPTKLPISRMDRPEAMDEIPVDARKVRFEAPVRDIEMADAPSRREPGGRVDLIVAYDLALYQSPSLG
ncbi:hypothetical protein C8J57DRAFT_1210689 [Mycena rebaudengoi]|nr:hypothetical protein C8J57DRAFT_1210689 [Mycena rebaudengoi]